MMVDGIARRGNARGEAKLAVDRADVGVDGTGTDDQALGHLGVGKPLC